MPVATKKGTPDLTKVDQLTENLRVPGATHRGEAAKTNTQNKSENSIWERTDIAEVSGSVLPPQR